MKEKNNGTKNASKSCPQKDSFFAVETTADGSPTVRGPLGETYHSLHGALLESAYVYRDSGLRYFIDQHSPSGTLPSSIHILEAGLGTGLNALLAYQTVRDATPPIHLFYSAIEKYPLPKSVTDQLEYTPHAREKEVLETIHSCPWDIPFAVDDRFTILKHRTDILDYALHSGNPRAGVPEKIHVVYYDLFSPAVQRELWTEEVLLGIVPHLETGAVLTTYSCTGFFRRLLEKLGFITERLPGPGTKRQILRAVYQEPYGSGSVT